MVAVGLGATIVGLVHGYACRGSNFVPLILFVRHAKPGKRDLSLYSQCDTYATLSPNCRDSVAYVSFKGDIALRCCCLSRTVAPLIKQNRAKNFGQLPVFARIDQKIG